jgi:hypothetical protein
LHHQRGRTLQDVLTSLAPADVLAAAKAFFQGQNGIYAAFVEREGPNHLVFRGQGGEEIALAAHLTGGVTRVSGSSYMFDAQVARFLASLPVAVAAEAPLAAPAEATT